MNKWKAEDINQYNIEPQLSQHSQTTFIIHVLHTYKALVLHDKSKHIYKQMPPAH